MAAASAESFDRVELLLVGAALLLLLMSGAAGPAARARRAAEPSPSAGQLVWNWLCGGPAVPFRLRRGERIAAVAVARIGAVVAVAAGVAVTLVWGPVGLAVAVAVAAVAGLGVRRLVRRWRGWLAKQGAWPDIALGFLVGNFVSGAPLVAGPVAWETDSRWSIAGARLKRALPRLAAVTVAGAGVYRLAVWPLGGGPMGGALWLAAAVGLVWPLVLAWLVVAVARRLVDAAHYREVVLPLHDVLAPVFNLDRDVVAPERWLDVPRDLIEGDGGITVTMPRGFLPDDKKKGEIVWTLATSLGLADYRTEWRLNGRHRHLHVASKERSVADLVPFDDEFRKLLEASPIHRKAVGRTVGDRPFYIDRQAENPHTLLSCPTGWGKTTAVGIELADTLHKGGEVVCLDIKFGSMRWAYDLPGVTYARTVEDIHRIMVDKVGPELLRRREVLGATHWEREPRFTPIFFVFEEMNSLTDELREFWIEERARLKAQHKADGVPFDASQRSPALRVYRQLGYMGRQLCMYMTVISQRGEANALGGSGPRGQLGNIILGWPTLADWKMHAPQHPYPGHANHPGRAHVVRGKHIHEVQFVRATPAELRSWALGGKEPATTLSQVSQPNRTPSHQGEGGGTVLAHPTLAAVPDDPTERPGVTLRQASSDRGEGLCAENLGQLQTYSKRYRNRGFPQPLTDDEGNLLTDPATGAHLYDEDELAHWSAGRAARRGHKAVGR